jgi:Zn-dependent protease
MSWTIGTVFGIPVRLHYSMLLLPFLTMNWVSTDGLLGLVSWLGLAVLLFGSVLLHELGHALTARRFGVHTYDIVLTPIGGMARVVNMPKNPRHEIAIAIAGPLVSLAIAGVSFFLQIPLALLPIAIPSRIYEALFVLSGANVVLGVFNLIPALPMDGGRVLRGALALKRDYLTATRIAARIGRILAVAGGLYALYIGHWPLALIAVFVYISAGSEVRMATLRAYQETAKDSPFEGPFGPFASSSDGGPRRPGNVWTWTWRTGQDYPPGPSPRPRQRPPEDPPDRSWSAGDNEYRREVINIGGKAEVISRKDPDPEK